MKLIVQHKRRISALFLILCLCTPGIAQQSGMPLPPQQPPPAEPISDEDLQPKFIWGLLLNFAFKAAMSVFATWLQDKVSNEVDDGSMGRMLLNSASTVVVSLQDFGIISFKSAGAEENTVVGKASKPMRVEKGRENYQGVHVALVGFDSALKPTGLRPVGAGFRTGERIKLKVLPTFDALLVIENINPKGQRVQIFPAQASQALSIKAGVEIVVPPASDEFFEFADSTGEEQLVITVRDRRAFGEGASKEEVSRKDEDTGSIFVQEVSDKTFPVIAQSMKLRHSK